MKTLYESILDDEDEVMNTIGSDTVEKYLRDNLNTLAETTLVKNKISVKYGTVYPHESIYNIKRDGYVIDELESLEFSPYAWTQQNGEYVNSLSKSNLFLLKCLDQFPHIHHIGELIIWINETFDSDVLDLSKLDVDKIDSLKIGIDLTSSFQFQIKGGKTKIEKMRIYSSTYNLSTIRPHLIKGFKCKDIILDTTKPGFNTIGGIIKVSSNEFQINDIIEFNELYQYNDFKRILYKYNERSRYLIKPTDNSWVLKKTSIKF